MDEQAPDSKLSGGYNDLANYAEMLKPFVSSEAAEAAVVKFFEAVSAIRKECRLADVHCILFVPVQNSTTVSTFHLGNTALAETMCATALGIVQKENKARLDSLADTQPKKRKSRKGRVNL